MKNYLLALAVSLCALPMPSEAGIFSRFVRVGSALNDRTKSLESFGMVYTAIVCAPMLSLLSIGSVVFVPNVLQGHLQKKDVLKK